MTAGEGHARARRGPYLQRGMHGALAGNLATASPAGDALPPLLLRGAAVEVASLRGTRNMPPVESVLIEDAEPDAPYGLKGVGEPPTVVATAAVVATLRDASGRPLTRTPVGPDEMVGL